jgi:hypothetical protein
MHFHPVKCELDKEKSMKKLILIAALIALAPAAVPVFAQTTKKDPKSTEGQVRKARKEDPTVRQVTPDPKKSPAKHADNLSKNVNHEADRESKDINRGVKHETTKVHKARKEDHTVRQVTPDPKKSPAKHADNLSKNVNHELKRTGKHISNALGIKKHKKHTDD